VQLVNAKVRSRRSVAADLGEEDPDGELERIVQEAEQLAALDQTEAAGEDQEHPEGTRDEEDESKERDDQESDAAGQRATRDPAATGLNWPKAKNRPSKDSDDD
jgi:hypothetical protein